LMEIFHASAGMDMLTRNRLQSSGIQLLRRAEYKLVSHQLYGIYGALNEPIHGKKL
jgi:hypothetical protein